MRIIQISIFLALVLTAGALCGNSTVRASERELVKKEKRLEDVKKRIRETERSIKEIFRTETTILGEVEKVSRTIAKKREELERVNASLKGITREINKTDANLRVGLVLLRGVAGQGVEKGPPEEDAHADELR